MRRAVDNVAKAVATGLDDPPDVHFGGSVDIQPRGGGGAQNDNFADGNDVGERTAGDAVDRERAAAAEIHFNPTDRYAAGSGDRNHADPPDGSGSGSVVVEDELNA